MQMQISTSGSDSFRRAADAAKLKYLNKTNEITLGKPVEKTAGNWDTFVKDSTNQYGSSAIPPTGSALSLPSTSSPAAGTSFYAEQPSLAQKQLAMRRYMDNRSRYGNPVSQEEMQRARGFGAV